MARTSGDINRSTQQPYDVFFPCGENNISFHADFIPECDRYFMHDKNQRMVGHHKSMVDLFISFADGGADNDDSACTALDVYLSTLKGQANA